MTYLLSRDGQSMGTFTQEALERLLTQGVVLSTDLVFIDKEQRWVPVGDLPKNQADPKNQRDEVNEFTERLKVATPRAFITPSLVVINVAVFLAMVIAGVSIVAPMPSDLIRWGADFGPLVTQGAWWRLLTAAFVHVGILHITLNMWVLLSGGSFTERLYGPSGFLTLYLLSAVGGSLASIARHPFTVGAGASGAIFGVYGALLGSLVVQRKSIPKKAAAWLGNNAVTFVGCNMLFGAIGNWHIDRAAHLGGLVTGIIAGCGLAYRVDPVAGGATWQRSIAVALLTLALFVPIGLHLRIGNTTQAEAYAADINGKTITIGKNDRIVYSGAASEADAKRLAQTLKIIGLMNDRGMLILYTKTPAESVVSFLVTQDEWENQKLSSTLGITSQFIVGITGTPLRVQLLTHEGGIKAEVFYNRHKGSVQFGKVFRNDASVGTS